MKKPVRIEFTGYLRVFKDFGNCGEHPQFRHVDNPPDGYIFVNDGKKFDSLNRYLKILICMVKLLLFSPALCKMFIVLKTKGVPFGKTFEFLRARDLYSQIMLPMNTKLAFYPSVPFTFGMHNWVIEIEDTSSFFFPYLSNGRIPSTMNKNSDYFQAIKYLLENHRCKAVITHVKSTVKSIDLLFNNKQISQKTIYLPMGISTLGIPEKSAGPQNCKTLLFTCSWHQDPNSFYLRGGVDLLVAYDKLHQEFGNSVRLILKCRIPEDLDAQYRNIIDKCQVRVVEHFLEDSELNELMASADFFMLPAARIHVISILQAMSWGKVLVTSDGWGIQEYVEHDQTAIIIPGRYGRYSCLDEKNGWLMENYALMNRHDDVFADKMFREMRILLNDPDRACRIGLNARQAVKEKFSAEVLNRNLKNIFDKLI